ncbi:MAG TPA: class I SAM-dependent methyltransferase [Nocardioidaceae bacterium]|jgi:SAM-dependent methyltransferase
MLARLAGGSEARVLDLGAGEGSVARPLTAYVGRVDAVEVSPAMVAIGRRLPRGDAPNLCWHIERAEHLTACGPFDLVVAGAAMHWFDLDAVIDRLADVTAADTPVALVDRQVSHPGLVEVTEVIKRHSRAPEHDPGYDVTEELTTRGLWRPLGEHHTAPVDFRQSPRDYLLALRSTATLARELMDGRENDVFDDQILRIATPLADSDGTIPFVLTSRVVWGTLPRCRPIRGS